MYFLVLDLFSAVIITPHDLIYILITDLFMPFGDTLFILSFKCLVCYPEITFWARFIIAVICCFETNAKIIRKLSHVRRAAYEIHLLAMVVKNKKSPPMVT